MDDPSRKPTRPDLPAQRPQRRERATWSGRRRNDDWLRALCASEPNCCRGVSLLPIIARARRGDFETFRQRVWDRNEELGELLDSEAIGMTTWYPISWYRLLLELLRVDAADPQRLAREVGRESVQEDLTRGPFRSFLKIVSPGFLIERGSVLFRSYVKQGRLKVERVPGREGVLELTFTQCAGFDAAIFQDFFGGIEGALLAAGAQEVSVECLEGARDGDDFARVRVSYR